MNMLYFIKRNNGYLEQISAKKFNCKDVGSIRGKKIGEMVNRLITCYWQLYFPWSIRTLLGVMDNVRMYNGKCHNFCQVLLGGKSKYFWIIY